MEAANEELKASNEEIRSINEELQASNEELETSKEELQSLNEELNTVNNQLQAKVGELEARTDDLNNLLNSTDVATLFLDRSLCIRWFTPSMKALLELLPTDIGRPISHFAQRFSDGDLLEEARKVLERLLPSDAEVVDDLGRWYIRHIVPYRTAVRPHRRRGRDLHRDHRAQAPRARGPGGEGVRRGDRRGGALSAGRADARAAGAVGQRRLLRDLPGQPPTRPRTGRWRSSATASGTFRSCSSA